MIILLVAAPQTFIDISIKIFYTSTSIGKCHTAMKIHPVQFVLPQFYPIKTMRQALCFDIEYWRSYGPFMSNKSQWSKMQNIYDNFFNSQYNNIPLRWLSTASTTGHFDVPLLCLYPSSNRWGLCVWSLPWSFKRGSSRVLLNIPIL